MLRLRNQVDRIDQRLLQLLQQRTRLSCEIGRTKRHHGAEIYVPDRERELLARVLERADGVLPPEAINAIFRQILSSSRAAQGQPPIGLLRRSAAAMLPTARAHFGACDRFVSFGTVAALRKDLMAGKLAVALLTALDLAAFSSVARRWFPDTLQVVGEVAPEASVGRWRDRLFIVKPSQGGTTGRRALVLIECKPSADAVKTKLRTMPPRFVKHVEAAGFPALSTLAAIDFTREVAGSDIFPPDAGITLLGFYFVN